MATKQARSNADENNERARAILPTFDASGDPWRQAPSLAGLNQALGSQIYAARDASTRETGSTKAFGDPQYGPYADRYGTGGSAQQDADYEKPPMPDTTQADSAKQKGASVGSYRADISGVVQ